MPSIDLTADFKTAVNERQQAGPSGVKRPKSPRGNGNSKNGEPSMGKEFLAEAHNILGHIGTLSQMLEGIRKPYLNLDSRYNPMRRSELKLDLTGGDTWTHITHLSNEERDQIDLQARVILTRCAERVKEMEALEKRRAELIASRTNPFTRLLPASLRQDLTSLSSDVLAAHHAGVTWYLNRRLAEASQAQKELQEERVKRQLERSRTLGSGATREVLRMDQESSSPSRSSQPRNSGGGWLEGIASTLGGTSRADSDSSRSSYEAVDYAPTPEDDEEIELTSSQILQFEQENANILRAAQDTLESVQQAESRLMEISALQMELVEHLTKQTELTDKMYNDAITTTSTMEQGNEQLQEARRRAKDSRIFILVFLLGASFSLLFLHYY